MENLVIELEKITFRQNFQSVIEEKRYPIMSDHCTEEMLEPDLVTSVTEIDVVDNEGGNASSASINSSEDSFEDVSDGQIGSSKDQNETGRRLRNLPSRSSRISSQNKRDLRISMKPAKIKTKSSSGNLKPSEIRKLYSNKKLGSFHPTKLETIFEEPQPIRSRLANTSTSDGDNSQVRWVGTTKVKRALNCCDGLNVKKSSFKHRRAMIKKNFGKRHTWTKMPLTNFIEHMQNVSNPSGNLDGIKEEGEDMID